MLQQLRHGTLALQLTWNTTGCVIVDTLKIAGNGDVLGGMPADTTLCAGDPLLLRAVSATSDLRWQDGSTGPSFRVELPGLYWVAAVGSEAARHRGILCRGRGGGLLQCAHTVAQSARQAGSTGITLARL